MVVWTSRHTVPGIVSVTDPYQRVFPPLHLEVLKFSEPNILLGRPFWLKPIIDDFPVATRRPCLEDLVGQEAKTTLSTRMGQARVASSISPGRVPQSQLTGHGSFASDEGWIRARRNHFSATKHG